MTNPFAKLVKKLSVMALMFTPPKVKEMLRFPLPVAQSVELAWMPLLGLSGESEIATLIVGPVASAQNTHSIFRTREGCAVGLP